MMRVLLLCLALGTAACGVMGPGAAPEVEPLGTPVVDAASPPGGPWVAPDTVQGPNDAGGQDVLAPTQDARDVSPGSHPDVPVHVVPDVPVHVTPDGAAEVSDDTHGPGGVVCSSADDCPEGWLCTFGHVCVDCAPDCPPPGGGHPELAVGPVPGGAWAPLSVFFDKPVSVFGVNVFASAGTPDAKVLHAAHVLAQYLDNDEDGEPDDPAVLVAMVDHPGGSSLVMFADDAELEQSGIFESALPDQFPMQDLWGTETHPEGSSLAGGFDATLEEVWHLVSSRGWASAYPDVFGEHQGTELTAAMDEARGGVFLTVPGAYPEAAWYHYDDVTCDYECMATEYFYWALTSRLGAQAYPGRCAQIADEWEPCTAELLEATDATVWELLTASGYALPTVLPDGGYQD